MKGKLNSQEKGLTLIELVAGLAIVAILAVIAVPVYNQQVDKARVSQAVKDIGVIEGAIQKHYTENFNYPETLRDVDMDHLRDPWQEPYSYLNIADRGKKSKGGLRKDRNNNPINSDYDLYSKGKDGRTSQALTSKLSYDDIIRANNGGYIGVAAEY